MADEGPDRPSLGRSLGLFALALAGVAVIGLVAGIAYGRGTPERAAGTILNDLVVVEDFQGDDRVPAVTDDPAPTSGDHVGDPACGVLEGPIDADTQLASLVAGRVVVQYHPDELTDDDLASLLDWWRDGRQQDVVVAPNRGLDAPVVATAWTRRLPLRGVETQFLGTFVTAYAGGGPRPAPCDGPAGADE